MTHTKRQAIDVLLVEDDGVLGGTVAQRLRLEGLSIIWAQSVAEALENITHIAGLVKNHHYAGTEWQAGRAQVFKCHLYIEML